MSMGKRLQIQAHSANDREAGARLARARTAQAGQGERAKVVLAALAGEGVGAIAARVQLSPATVYLWLHRSEQQGLAGLADQPRRGRPPTSPREQVSTIIATALTDPQTLGQAYSAWTLDRLVAYLAEHQGIAMNRSRLDQLLLAQGEGGLDPGGERVDAVLDNLSAHRATDVLLFARAHPSWEFVCQPPYAASLNLTEPWWKILRSLALKGRRFESWQEVCQAVAASTAYWNAHRHPFVWGRRRRHRPRRQPGIALTPTVT